MKSKTLNILSVIAAISLVGILFAQGAWLRKSTKTAAEQFDHRADRVLEDVVSEMQTYADTSSNISFHMQQGDLHFYHVVDTVLLRSLLYKYARYHNLGDQLTYALVYTDSEKEIYSSKEFESWQEAEAYKVCLSCIWKQEYIHLSVYFPDRNKNIQGRLLVWVIISLLFTLTTIGAFIFIVITYNKQKKVVEIKNDFVNNMTHELKTPLATISVASEVLLKFKENSEEKKVHKYSKIIFDENSRMRKLVDKVLDIATLDKGHVHLDKEEMDLHSTICKTVSNFCFEACNNEVKIDYQLNAGDSVVVADKVHLRNVVNNLVDNAVKYSVGTPEIIISSENDNGYLKLSVADKGKGIPKDALTKVFEKFYRVPVGNIHNVKGFGLGLFYVKTMMEAHGGYVELQSVINKGTKVDLFIPQ